MKQTSITEQKTGVKNIMRFASLMLVSVCSFIGAGFVSGAEIYEFFARFKFASFVGVTIFFFLSFLLCYKILKMSENPARKHKNTEFVDNLNFNLKMCKNTKIKCKNTFLNKNFIRNAIIFCNCFFISGAMVSGLKNLIFKFYFSNCFLVFFVCIVIAFSVCCLGVKGLDKLDVFVLGFVAVLCFVFITDNSFGIITSFASKEQSFSFGFNGLFASIFFAALYVFMNILQFEPLVRTSGCTFSKKSALLFALLFAMLLSLPLLCFVLFLNCNLWLAEKSMPFLSFFIIRGGFISKIFGFGLLISLLTTLITCLIGVKDKLAHKLNCSNFIAAGLGLWLVLLISMLPFKFFVSVLYPILGVLNFIVFAFL